MSFLHHDDIRYNLAYKIITVSSSRTEENDISGSLMASMVGNNAERALVKDNEVSILSELFNSYNSTDVFIYIGGTGASRLDQTSTAIRKIADKEMRGFGELFRYRSGGTFPYMSDSSLFIYQKKIIITLPGSEDAQKIGFELLKEMVNHLYHEINKE
ncbi:MAG: molybdopterin-binding protein [Ferroplasma sp.]